LLRSLASDAEPGADLGPGVAAAAQPLDRPGYRGVDLVGEIGHENQGLDIDIADPASVGTQDAPDECAVLVVLHLPPSPFGVNPALTLSGLGSWPAGDVLAAWSMRCRGLLWRSC
jgi:hypothetical protein